MKRRDFCLFFCTSYQLGHTQHKPHNSATTHGEMPEWRKKKEREMEGASEGHRRWGVGRMKTRKEWTKIQGTLLVCIPRWIRSYLDSISTPATACSLPVRFLSIMNRPLLLLDSLGSPLFSFVVVDTPCSSLSPGCSLFASVLCQLSHPLDTKEKVSLLPGCVPFSLPIEWTSYICSLSVSQDAWIPSFSVLSTMMSNVHFDMYPLEFSLSSFYPLWSLVVCSPGLVVEGFRC